MPIPATVAEFAGDPDSLTRRRARIQDAAEALEGVARGIPAGQAVPLPLQLALRDFRRELRRLGDG